ncbi:hypothetical protein EZS27_010435 [termite gut metagenome]|uniref:Uncharacterized protein n=1 Tax=termite gut metagenome TaxID=433724 RepID=A0A5J4S7F5_9ZZZZ
MNKKNLAPILTVNEVTKIFYLSDEFSKEFDSFSSKQVSGFETPFNLSFRRTQVIRVNFEEDKLLILC